MTSKQRDAINAKLRTSQNKSPMTAEEIDNLLSSMRTLKFTKYTHDKELSIDAFLSKIFYLLENHNTVLSDTNSLNCYYGKRRSVVDMYRICKYYYPKQTNIKVISDFIYKNRNSIQSTICTTVLRRVFTRMPSGGPIGGKKEKDEFGLTWNEFLELRKDKT